MYEKIFKDGLVRYARTICQDPTWLGQRWQPSAAGTLSTARLSWHGCMRRELRTVLGVLASTMPSFTFSSVTDPAPKVPPKKVATGS